MHILLEKSFESNEHECFYDINSDVGPSKFCFDDHEICGEQEEGSDSHISLTQLQCCQCSVLASQRAPRSTKLYEE